MARWRDEAAGHRDQAERCELVPTHRARRRFGRLAAVRAHEFESCVQLAALWQLFAWHSSFCTEGKQALNTARSALAVIGVPEEANTTTVRGCSQQIAILRDPKCAHNTALHWGCHLASMRPH